MVELRILGSTELLRENGELEHSFLAGPKRLGLLAYLVLARPRGFHRRDVLLPLFWPEHGQKSARNALSNMLYHIRRVLGDVIENRGREEIGIRAGSFWCDVIAFERALNDGRLHEALSLYRGDLLKGFHVSNASPGFGQWLDRERERMRQRATEAAWQLSEREDRAGNLGAAQVWSKRAAGFTPFSEEAHRRLITVLDRTGDRAGALEAYEDFATRFRGEWDIEPSDDIRALVKEIRLRRPRSGSEAVDGERSSDRSIAVLPFETLGAKHATAFTKGIHGDVLTRLSSVADLRVISGTSVRRYENTKKPVAQIGRELGVAWVVEGEVQEAAGQVQVRTRLIDARKDRQVWATDYRRDLNAQNVFEIQTEITRQMVSALEAHLTPEEERQIERTPTESLAAYRLHAQGRRLLEQRTAASMRQAMKYFEQAIEEDPGYPLAWVGLADTLTLLYGYAHEEEKAGLTRAEEAARRALELDPNLAEAHASLGVLHNCYMDGPAMVRAKERAVELRPSYADAHNWLSWAYQQVGQAEKALESAERAVELDPLSPEAVGNLAFSCLITGDVERALREARRAIELEPERVGGMLHEGLCLYYLGRYDEAIAVLEDLSVPWADSGPQSTLALAYVAAGEEDDARRLLAQFAEAGDHFAIGLVRAALGETDEAFEAFERIEDWGSDLIRDMWPTLVIHHLFPDVLGPLREDPRWDDLQSAVYRAWRLEPDGSLPPGG